MCVCESATEKGAADALESPVTRLAYRQGHSSRSAAIVNGGGATDFCARFLDAEDRPLTALTIRLP
jgi:hypothetical protein